MENLQKLPQSDYSLLMGYVQDYRLSHDLPYLQEESVDFAAYVLLKINALLESVSK